MKNLLSAFLLLVLTAAIYATIVFAPIWYVWNNYGAQAIHAIDISLGEVWCGVFSLLVLWQAIREEPRFFRRYAYRRKR